MASALIIGSGIVGLCTAWHLQQEGWAVTLVDPRAPGTGCSAGNPGGISVSSVLPAAAPGVIAKVPGWLLDRDGPLTIRPAHLPRLAPWLLRFLRASSRDRFLAGMAAVSALTRQAPDRWRALLGSAGLSPMMQHDGNMIVYRSRAQHDAETASWQRRAALGLTVVSLGPGEVQDILPDLSPEYSLARRVGENARLSDPLAVCQALAQQLMVRGAVIRATTVRDLQLDPDGRPGVRTDEGALQSDLVVLAAGAWSAPLARQAGDRIPLEPERGYSVSWAEAGISIPLPVFSPSEKIMASPVAGGLRLAGSAEFAGFTASPDWSRAEALVRLGRRMFPGLTGAAPVRWAGLRPSTPDGLPVIGRSRWSPRVIHAFGHGHLGVTNAALTGRIVADLAADRPPPLDLTLCAPGRFRLW